MVGRACFEGSDRVGRACLVDGGPCFEGRGPTGGLALRGLTGWTGHYQQAKYFHRNLLARSTISVV